MIENRFSIEENETMCKMLNVSLGAALFAAAVLVGCPTPGASNPSPEAGAAPCASACGNLRAIGCSDGFGVDGGQSCEAICQHALDGTYDMHTACLAAAQSVAAARACMSVSCP